MTWPDLGPQADRFSEIVAQLRDIGERLDTVAERRAQAALERAADITSMRMEPDDPYAAPVAAWKSELEARRREGVRHERMVRVPLAPAMTASAARIREPEAGD
jgi:hypothetical protein